MEKIAKHIEELLENHECVILPDFGGIIVNKVPAKIDPVQHKFVPPSVTLGFNAKLKNNDGLLVNHIAEREKIKYEEAKVQVKQFVEKLSQRIEIGEVVALPGIGKFTKRAGVLLFTAGNATDLDKDSFGLSTFHAIPVKRKTLLEEKKESLNIPINKTVSERNKGDRKKVIRYVGYSVAALPVLAYLLWVPTQSGMLNKGQKFQTSDLNPFSNKVCTEYTRRTGNEFFEESNVVLEENTLQSIDKAGNFTEMHFETTEGEHKTLVVELNKPLPKVESASTTTTRENSYHLITGCFKEKSNASKFIRELKSNGFGAYLLDLHKGLYRVSGGQYLSKREAKQAAGDFKRKLNKSAWVLFK